MSAPTSPETAVRIARILALAVAVDQSPNAFGITPQGAAGCLLDRLPEGDRELAMKALDALGVSL